MSSVFIEAANRLLRRNRHQTNASSMLRSVDYAREIILAQQAIASWNRFHPMGAITIDEQIELNNLRHALVGLKLAQALEKGAPFRQSELEWMEGEDWKN